MESPNAALFSLCSILLLCCFVGLGAYLSSDRPAKETSIRERAADGQRAERQRAGSGERPNIVLIMADDLGYGDLGSYGQRHIRTPHLDRMAREGLRFTQFYAGSTVCAPSRSVLMTGQHTGHTPIRGNRPVLPIGSEPLPAASETVAEVLQQAGYHTGLFGKWGLGGPQSESTPRTQGFDAFFGYLDQRRAHYYWPEFLFESNKDSLWRVPLAGNEVEDDPERHPGAGPPIRRGTYAHDAIMERALSFIEEQARTEHPFFAYLPTIIPHRQLEVPESALRPYLTSEGESLFQETPSTGAHYGNQPLPNATYAAMISTLDASVGRLFEKLRDVGAAENTLVLFTSDNGPTPTQHVDLDLFNSNGPLRGIKRDLFEGGLRVPLIAWGPGQGIPAGATSHHIGYLGDLMATFAEWAGTEAPEPNDSISMAAILSGREQAQQRRDYLYWEFYGKDTKQAVRRGRWKAIRRPMGASGTTALYDLERDLSERQDVASEHPEVVREIEALMEAAHTPSPLWEVGSQKWGADACKIMVQSWKPTVQPAPSTVCRKNEVAPNI